MIENSVYKIRNSMSLEAKESLSLQRIKNCYDFHQGKVFVSFSGGKDSTALLHLVREYYPHIPAVFCNTGLEYPEIYEFVKKQKNVTIIRPKHTFRNIIDKYGYPIISKAQAKYIYEYRNAKSEKTKDARWNGKYGKKMYKISEKWKYLVDAPFLISDKCCYYLKKQPFQKYMKESGRYPILGLMGADSNLRKLDYLKYGCNAFSKKSKECRPIMFWNTSDIWEYIRKYNIEYSEIYKKGIKNTGCIYCGFGAHMNSPNRFQLMKQTHPKLWKYCMEKMGIRKVLDFCHIPCE